MKCILVLSAILFLVSACGEESPPAAAPNNNNVEQDMTADAAMQEPDQQEAADLPAMLDMTLSREVGRQNRSW
jgi:hypothetical protein